MTRTNVTFSSTDIGVISASGTKVLGPIILNSLTGTYSAELSHTGDGTAKVTVLVSNDPDATSGTEKQAGDEILTGVVKTAAGFNDGVLPFGAKVWFKITETGASNTITGAKLIIRKDSQG